MPALTPSQQDTFARLKQTVRGIRQKAKDLVKRTVQKKDSDNVDEIRKKMGLS